MRSLPKNELRPKPKKPKELWLIKLSKKLYLYHLFIVLFIVFRGLIYLLFELPIKWLKEKVKYFLQKTGILKTEVFIPELTIDEMYAGKTDDEIREAIWAKDEDDLTSDESIYKFAITIADEQRAGRLKEDELQNIQ